MNQQDLIAYKKAKKDIQTWVATFSELHSKGKSFEEFGKEKKEDTAFYKWYSTDGKTLSSFDSYKIIETTYDEIFEEFDEYLKTLKEPETKSFFGSKKKRKLNSKAKAIKYHAKKLTEILNLFGSVIRNIVAQSGGNIEAEVENITPEKENLFIKEETTEIITPEPQTVIEASEEEVQQVEETEEISAPITNHPVEEITEEVLEEEDEEYEDDDEDNNVTEENLEDEIEAIRKQMEEDFLNKMKDLGL